MEEVEDWIKKARSDLITSKINLKNKRYDASAFFSHQASEKALKALFILKHRRLWRIHDLRKIAEKLGAPKSLLISCERLNRHYIATRYPIAEEYSRLDAEKALKDAERWLNG